MLEREKERKSVCEKERKREGECERESLFQREREEGREREERVNFNKEREITLACKSAGSWEYIGSSSSGRTPSKSAIRSAKT